MKVRRQRPLRPRRKLPKRKLTRTITSRAPFHCVRPCWDAARRSILRSDHVQVRRLHIRPLHIRRRTLYRRAFRWRRHRDLCAPFRPQPGRFHRLRRGQARSFRVRASPCPRSSTPGPPRHRQCRSLRRRRACVPACRSLRRLVRLPAPASQGPPRPHIRDPLPGSHWLSSREFRSHPSRQAVPARRPSLVSLLPGPWFLRAPILRHAWDISRVRLNPM
jgi:hypothetical protein